MSKIDYTNSAIFAYPKPPKTEKNVKKAIKGKKHTQTKETDIPKKVKIKVWERDHKRCIFCGKYVSWNYANAHLIPRSAGGLGVEQNIFTACNLCHQEQDNGFETSEYTKDAEAYLKAIYGKGWNKNKLIYKKYGGIRRIKYE